MPRNTAVGVLSGFLVCAVAILVLPATAAEVLSDLAQLLAAGLACLSAARYAARTADGRLRASWAVLSLACASWCAGQAYWTWAAARAAAVPFPSAADLGYLGFALLAVAALLLHPAAGGATARWQRAWDAVMTAGALGLIIWDTTLSAVVADSADLTSLARILLLTYPLADVVLLVLAILLLSRTTGQRTALNLVGVGVLCLGVADSAFIYLAATSSYTGGLVDLGWLGAFLLIALAGTCRPGARDAGQPTASRQPVRPATSPLPYLPVVVAAAVVLLGALTGHTLSAGEQVVGVLIVAALLARQYLALRDNTRLAADLAAREVQLQHQALHDPLTGLANRSLFGDRLEHALQLHARDMRTVSVIFLDLDDFKGVNDSLGHAAGDELLLRVAERLKGALRTGDTVARLGGDEFAVLLEDSGDPLDSAGRILGALGMPFVLAGQALAVHGSIGVVALRAGDAAVSADRLLAAADAAMYCAKRAGKSRIAAADLGQDRSAPAPTPAPQI